MLDEIKQYIRDRSMNSDELGRLQVSVKSIYGMLLRSGTQGLLDLQTLIPLLLEQTLNKEEFDFHVFPLLSFMRQEFNRLKYEESLDLDS